MRVLVVGSGGREHALAWKISRSALVETLFAAPGNPGIAKVARLVDLRAEDVSGIVRFCGENGVDLVVIGPETPLVLGLADRLREKGTLVFGPGAEAAEIEGSKAFAKDVMNAAGIPTAEYATFEEVEPALRWARRRDGQVVVKADGLAAGKGVVVCSEMSEVEEALRSMLVARVHGDAGATVLLEERLFGREASCIGFTDGERVLMLAAAQDHKRVGDGDTGPNTGGMGAFSPTPEVSEELLSRVRSEVLEPAVRELARRGRPFRGALYAGLILTQRGPLVLEFNARLGDPETRPILQRLTSDVVPALVGASRGDLSGLSLEFDRRASVGVVLAAENYPLKPVLSDVILGADGPFEEGVEVFHAGTRSEPDGRLVTAGGRVLTVCALGDDLALAARRAYAAADQITFRGRHARRDIGTRV